MTDQEDAIVLDKNVCDDNSYKKTALSCLGQTGCRFSIVFLSQLFVIVLKNFSCFWKNYLSKTYDESTVWVGISYSAAR